MNQLGQCVQQCPIDYLICTESSVQFKQYLLILIIMTQDIQSYQPIKVIEFYQYAFVLYLIHQNHLILQFWKIRFFFAIFRFQQFNQQIKCKLTITCYYIERKQYKLLYFLFLQNQLQQDSF
ncbi:unnamed protein product [Paramecium sonneborni]|uniref:Uncharacterized protein n=1 Tax=Paramecium sonneborni TaxID=65129 RepID=A0A8S1RRH6_9CILI|nr:unnamed protein product [Paramecium sonneborni]